MTVTDLSPREVSRWAQLAGLPLEADRLDLVAATAHHIQTVLRPLRDLDFAETAPAAPYDVPAAPHDAPATPYDPLVASGDIFPDSPYGTSRAAREEGRTDAAV
ncbi:hypothetical protein [Streptomyces sp. NPDC101393]|uniref:hypothetical protein n=1 Tax=Streptomyces sp. NPDC101393 TaxID=3366141 RepID=UPI0037FDF7A1